MRSNGAKDGIESELHYADKRLSNNLAFAHLNSRAEMKKLINDKQVQISDEY